MSDGLTDARPEFWSETVGVRLELRSIYTFNCLEIYFFQLRSSGEMMVVKNLAAFLAQILSFLLLEQIKL